VLKYSCHLATDNRFPFADFSGADKVTHFCLNCRKLANASLILPQRRWFSPAHATSSAHCFLSCLSDLRRGLAERMYCSILLYICHLDSFRPLIDNTESRLQNPWLLGTYPWSKNLPCSRYESRLVLSPCVFEREIQREERNHARFSTWYGAQHVAYCPPCGGYVLEKRQPVPYPRGQPAPSPQQGCLVSAVSFPSGFRDTAAASSGFAIFEVLMKASPDVIYAMWVGLK